VCVCVCTRVSAWASQSCTMLARAIDVSDITDLENYEARLLQFIAQLDDCTQPVSINLLFPFVPPVNRKNESYD
jgi:hypothetical protein